MVAVAAEEVTTYSLELEPTVPRVVVVVETISRLVVLQFMVAKVSAGVFLEAGRETVQRAEVAVALVQVDPMHLPTFRLAGLVALEDPRA